MEETRKAGAVPARSPVVKPRRNGRSGQDQAIDQYRQIPLEPLWDIARNVKPPSISLCKINTSPSKATSPPHSSTSFPSHPPRRVILTHFYHYHQLHKNQSTYLVSQLDWLIDMAMYKRKSVQAWTADAETMFLCESSSSVSSHPSLRLHKVV